MQRKVGCDFGAGVADENRHCERWDLKAGVDMPNHNRDDKSGDGVAGGEAGAAHSVFDGVADIDGTRPEDGFLEDLNDGEVKDKGARRPEDTENSAFVCAEGTKQQVGNREKEEGEVASAREILADEGAPRFG